MSADRPEEPRVLWLDGPPAEAPRVRRPQTLGELTAEFLAWMGREVRAGRYAQRTLEFYSYPLTRFANFCGPMTPLSDLIAYQLECFKTNWHSVVAVQRLANWAVANGLMERSPFRNVPKPHKPERERVLTRAEMLSLLRAARRHFRLFLIAMRETIARPGEVRALRWSQLVEVAPGAWVAVLTEFKGKKRRRDKAKARVIPMNGRMVRMLARLRRRWAERRTLFDDGDDYVFLNHQGRPWGPNAARCCMRRLRRRCGLPEGDQRLVVCYTIRHTSATNAVRNGVYGRALSDLMGHAQPSMTEKYLHLQPGHLIDAIREATKKL